MGLKIKITRRSRSSFISKEKSPSYDHKVRMKMAALCTVATIKSNNEVQ